MSSGRTAEYNEVRKKEILCKLKSTFVSQFKLDPPKKTFIKSKIFLKFQIKSFDNSDAKDFSNCPTVGLLQIFCVHPCMHFYGQSSLMVLWYWSSFVRFILRKNSSVKFQKSLLFIEAWKIRSMTKIKSSLINNWKPLKIWEF